MRKTVLALLSIAGFSVGTAIAADEPRKIELLAFLAEGDGLIGQTVTITGCQFRGADVRSVLCSAGSRGRVAIETTSLIDVKDANRALDRCRGFTNEFPVCRGSVTGKVTKTSVLKLVDARIIWEQKETD